MPNILYLQSKFVNNLVTAIFSGVFGLTLLIIGGELLVRGASKLAAALKVSPLVIGLTVVAFGTSSPELAVSIRSAISAQSDIALGNVVGSNIFNVLFILGISALIVPLVVSSCLIRRDVPIMILSSLTLLLFGVDGRISRVDGLMLFSALIAYTYWCIRQSRREAPEVKVELAKGTPQLKSKPSLFVNHVGLVVLGLVFLSIGSHFLVKSSVFVATRLGISELVIGLTIIAAGTSLPEVVTSVTAALRGQRDIAVGNVVGSNIFNILGVLGLASLLSSNGVIVSSSVLRFDIPIVIATAIACLPIFFTGCLITRWEGGVFLGYYIAYTTYLVLDITHSAITRKFTIIMVAFVIPLTVTTLLISIGRSLRKPTNV